ncbi:MAG: hypothetical protein RMJ83_09115 [Armatimonadota bacterium]|nr:hypothetical protein [Armatimonadota bacterium]
MPSNVEQALVRAYRVLTYASALLMVLGWGWHLLRKDQTNWLITVGVGVLLLTPLVALAYLGWLVRASDLRTARYSWLALVLLGAAVAIGLWIRRSP